ncbi:hypothetical protein AB0B27_12475 [Micromonospora rifamycinica]|uniref:hypothetical protein n=1 Tax=Micromonospora rifamycinica TaxID=291594 RepID=UPI0033EA5035
MDMFGYRLTQLLGHLPVLLTLLGVLVLAATARRRLPGRVRSLLLAGATILLLLELLSAAWVAALPELIRSRSLSGGMRQFELMNLTVSVVGWLGYPAGLGLVVAAVFVGRAATPATGRPWGAWTPPAGATTTGPPPGYPAGHGGPVLPGQPAGWGGSDRPPAAPPQVDRAD